MSLGSGQQIRCRLSRHINNSFTNRLHHFDTDGPSSVVNEVVVTDDIKGLPAHDPRGALTSLRVVVYDWDRTTDAITWGPNAEEVFGFDPTRVWPSGAAFEEACEAGSRADAIMETDQTDEGSGILFASCYQLRAPDGAGLFLVDDTGRWFACPEGGPAKVHGTMRLRREALAPPDGSRSRDAFLAQVGEDIADGKATGRSLTLFVIALANLGELNDDLGYEAADGVVDAVTVRLAGAMRKRDRLVRYSGNRFALALRGCGMAE